MLKTLVIAYSAVKDMRSLLNRITAFRKKLLTWFSLAGRSLPWRKTDDPYAIAVSEIMLQQTTVGTVKNHYDRFLARFPTIESLARASEDELTVAWKGLGYYRRARNLKKIAGLS